MAEDTVPRDDNEIASEAEAAIAELFEAYSAGFDDYDGEAVADCFAFPAVIWQFGKGNVFVDEEDLQENIEKLFAALEKEGVVRSEYSVLSAHVSGEVALVSLAWVQSDANDEPVFEFTCHYQLLFDDDEWLIAMIVNEH